MNSEVKNILNFLLNADCKKDYKKVNFYLTISKKVNKEREFDVFKIEINLNIGYLLLKSALDFLEVFDEKITNNELVIKNYIPGVNYDNTIIEKIKLNEVDNLRFLVEKSLDEVNLEIFSRDRYKDLWSYHYIIGDYSFFRIITKKKLIKKKGIFAIFFKEGVFNGFSEDFLVIDDNIDFIVNNKLKEVYIFNKRNFEVLSCFYEVWEEKVEKELPKFFKKIHINNPEFFKERVFRDIRKIKKLHSILTNGLYRDITTNVVMQIKEDFDLNIKFSENGRSIDINETDMWELLKTLDDDYLISQYTKNNYEVHSKIKK